MKIVSKKYCSSNSENNKDLYKPRKPATDLMLYKTPVPILKSSFEIETLCSSQQEELEWIKWREEALKTTVDMIGRILGLRNMPSNLSYACVDCEGAE